MRAVPALVPTISGPYHQRPVSSAAHHASAARNFCSGICQAPCARRRQPLTPPPPPPVASIAAGTALAHGCDWWSAAASWPELFACLRRQACASDEIDTSARVSHVRLLRSGITPPTTDGDGAHEARCRALPSPPRHGPRRSDPPGAGSRLCQHAPSAAARLRLRWRTAVKLHRPVVGAAAGAVAHPDPVRLRLHSDTGCGMDPSASASSTEFRSGFSGRSEPHEHKRTKHAETAFSQVGYTIAARR